MPATLTDGSKLEIAVPKDIPVDPMPDYPEDEGQLLISVVSDDYPCHPAWEVTLWPIQRITEASVQRYVVPHKGDPRVFMQERYLIDSNGLITVGDCCIVLTRKGVRQATVDARADIWNQEFKTDKEKPVYTL